MVTTDEPTIDEPTMNLHHYHPRPIDYIRVHSWCCTFYRFGQMYSDMYPSLWYHALKSHLCPACSSCPIPEPLATSDLYSVSIVLLFPVCHTVGITQCAAFSGWLLSLSHMHLRFLQVFSWLDGSFAFSAESYSIVRLCHRLFIY